MSVMAQGAVYAAPPEMIADQFPQLKFLKFLDGKKPKFTLSGTKAELGEFIKLVLGNSCSEDGSILWAEDAKHNMASCKINNLTFKHYSTTTTLCIQGQQQSEAKAKLYGLLGLHKNSNNPEDHMDETLEQHEDETIRSGEDEPSLNPMTYLV